MQVFATLRAYISLCKEAGAPVDLDQVAEMTFKQLSTPGSRESQSFVSGTSLNIPAITKELARKMGEGLDAQESQQVIQKLQAMWAKHVRNTKELQHELPRAHQQSQEQSQQRVQEVGRELQTARLRTQAAQPLTIVYNGETYSALPEGDHQTIGDYDWYSFNHNGQPMLFDMGDVIDGVSYREVPVVTGDGTAKERGLARIVEGTFKAPRFEPTDGGWRLVEGSISDAALRDLVRLVTSAQTMTVMNKQFEIVPTWGSDSDKPVAYDVMRDDGSLFFHIPKGSLTDYQIQSLIYSKLTGKPSGVTVTHLMDIWAAIEPQSIEATAWMQKQGGYSDSPWVQKSKKAQEVGRAEFDARYEELMEEYRQAKAAGVPIQEARRALDAKRKVLREEWWAKDRALTVQRDKEWVEFDALLQAKVAEHPGVPKPPLDIYSEGDVDLWYQAVDRAGAGAPYVKIKSIYNAYKKRGPQASQ